MSSSIQGISVFIRASILVLIFIVGSVAKRNIGMFLSFRVFGGRGRREVQNDIKPMMNPIELPLLNQTISNPFPIDIGAFGPERIVSPIMTLWDAEYTSYRHSCSAPCKCMHFY